MPYNPYTDWQQIHGEGFGFSPERLQRLFQSGAEDIEEKFQGIEKQSVADINERGFYSARPYGRMKARLGAAKLGELSDYRLGLTEQSENLAQWNQ